jgi:hypothetical protein
MMCAQEPQVAAGCAQARVAAMAVASNAELAGPPEDCSEVAAPVEMVAVNSVAPVGTAAEHKLAVAFELVLAQELAAALELVFA